MITQNEILTIVAKLAGASPINDLGGGIYKRKRPTASKLEDCVIGNIAGNSGKFLQDGNLSVKIFYLDIESNNTFFENESRGQALEQLLIDFSETLLAYNGISFEIQSRETYTAPVLDEEQHYAILKMDYKIV
jgi:hypothetical protein